MTDPSHTIKWVEPAATTTIITIKPLDPYEKIILEKLRMLLLKQIKLVELEIVEKEPEQTLEEWVES